MMQLGAVPTSLRMLLRAGADPEHRDREKLYGGRTRSTEAINGEVTADGQSRAPICSGRAPRGRLGALCSATSLRPARVARLCHRGRATFSARTPEVLVRLFGAPGRPGAATTRSRGASCDLPDPLFWRVLEFALGPAYDYPWVRERVRSARRPWLPLAEQL